MPDSKADDILDNSQNPQSASSDAGSVTMPSIRDQIAADEYAQKKSITNPFAQITFARGRMLQVDK